MARIIRKAVEIKSRVSPEPKTAVAHAPTGKSVSSRGLNLKKRLAKLANNSS